MCILCYHEMTTVHWMDQMRFELEDLACKPANMWHGMIHNVYEICEEGREVVC